MRNWNCCEESWTQKCYQFWLYLWGIETADKGKLTALNNEYFDSTYEELKLHFKKVIQLKQETILTLPMRNWNDVKASISKLDKEILTLPMRNWNKVSAATLWPRKKNFDSTYEELKRSTGSKSCKLYNNFDSTYEELKLYSISVKYHKTYCNFDSTYEELKLSSAIVFPASQSILTLPMRNWNKLNFIRFAPLPSILTLPMRNWNMTIKDINERINFTILTLPMRNWNKALGDHNYPQIPNFDSTYEELKP